MDSLLYLVVWLLVAFIHALPLTWVARMGRALGGLAYWLDARHRRVALQNLAMCFEKEKTPAEIRTLSQALDRMTERLQQRARYVAEFAATVSQTFWPSSCSIWPGAHPE